MTYFSVISILKPELIFKFYGTSEVWTKRLTIWKPPSKNRLNNGKNHVSLIKKTQAVALAAMKSVMLNQINQCKSKPWVPTRYKAQICARAITYVPWWFTSNIVYLGLCHVVEYKTVPMVELFGICVFDIDLNLRQFQ